MQGTMFDSNGNLYSLFRSSSSDSDRDIQPTPDYEDLENISAVSLIKEILDSQEKCSWSSLNQMN